MRRFLVVLLLSVLLCGCRAEQTLETVADEWVVPVMAQPREVTLRLPENVVAPVLEQEGRQLYMAEYYEIMLETMASGDLEATMRSLSGYGKENLTVVKTRQDNTDRYDFVWTTAGETGERMGRGVILDDGNYHYCLSVLKDAEKNREIPVVWRDLFSSFALV